jgi:hypothetical protein
MTDRAEGQSAKTERQNMQIDNKQSYFIQNDGADKRTDDG